MDWLTVGNNIFNRYEKSVTGTGAVEQTGEVGTVESYKESSIGSVNYKNPLVDGGTYAYNHNPQLRDGIVAKNFLATA